MRKENPSHTASMAFVVPPGYFSQTYPLIVEVLDSFVPGLAEKCPDFVTQVQSYVDAFFFDETVTIKKKEHILERVKQIEQQFSIYIDPIAFLLTIEGMTIVIREHLLQDWGDLELYAHSHQTMFKLWSEEYLLEDMEVEVKSKKDKDHFIGEGIERSSG
jgi:hypothetical protein